MPSGPEIMKGYGNPEEGDFSNLFGENEKPKNGSPEVLSDEDLEKMLENEELVVESKEISAEQVAKVYNTFLNDFEKKLVFSKEETFEKFVTDYEKGLIAHGRNENFVSKKIGVIKSIHKLVMEKDSRASLIERPNV